MSLDRRMVSILIHNNIEVTKVEKFIGINKENYYEILINGKIEKLKIPGVDYSKFDVPTVEHLETQIKQLDKNVEQLESLQSFSNSLEEVVESIKKEQFTETKIVKTPVVKLVTPKEEVSFEEELEKTEEENQKILETVKKDAKLKTTKSKKVTKPKNTDDEVDDFLDTI